MRLAVFFPASLFSAWACSYGLVDCLKRMGHEVHSVPVDPGSLALYSLTDARQFDGAIISGPEHIGKNLDPLFVRDVKIPKVAWLHETVEREDYGKLDVDAIKRSADIVFCPGIQDEKYGFRYLPFGVDTEIFKPHGKCALCAANYTLHEGSYHGVYDDDVRVPCTAKPSSKSIDAAFIGLLYPKRQAFLEELKSQGVNLVTGNVQVLELGGVNPRKTAELYAENIRKIKVLVNLPTLSQLAVTKIYEVLACGTPILTPDISCDRNLLGLPIRTYRSVPDLIELLKAGIFPSAEECSSSMQNAHRLELRCEKLISALQEIGTKAA